MSTLSNYDIEYFNKYQYICGIDEVGRGCLAGPLVVCGIIMDYNNIIEEVKDSKKLSEKKRDFLFPIIIDNCIAYEIRVVAVNIIDELNIYQATKQAMNEIATSLSNDNTLFLSDAMPLAINNNISIIKGDNTSYAIACASIMAKVIRDQMMCSLALQYPLYDFANNKGYGTKKHLVALEEYGYINQVHRKSYEPIKSMVNQQLKLNI
jgi:ribonuclease HII